MNSPARSIRVLNILIDDDVAVKDLYTQGRRGVGTTVLAEKSVVRLLSRAMTCSKLRISADAST